MLTLPIKRKWFDMIASGIKKEEYRDIKEYYRKRFLTMFLSSPDGIETFCIRLRAGYSKKSPLMECMVKISQGCGKEEWGAMPDVKYYILSILSFEIIST